MKPYSEKTKTVEKFEYGLNREDYEKTYGSPLRQWLRGVKGWSQYWHTRAKLFEDDHWGVC